MLLVRLLLVSFLLQFILRTDGGMLQVPCSALSSPGSLRLVTFDVFAALMQTQDSLVNSTIAALPDHASSASAIVTSWINCYGGNAGSTFDPARYVPQPFTWIMRSCLWGALNSSGLGVDIAPGTATFETLAVAWSVLKPYEGTVEALRALVDAGLRLGALSNGDRATLVNATSIFLSAGVPFWRVFPSDYPVGAFKPAAGMYEQVALAAAAEGWPPEAVLHAAGSATDAQGARTYGLLSVFISHGSAPAGSPAPCAVLENITLLPALLNTDSYPPSASVSPSASLSASASALPSAAAASTQAAAAMVGVSPGGVVAVSFFSCATGAIAVVIAMRYFTQARALPINRIPSIKAPAMAMSSAPQLSQVTQSPLLTSFANTPSGGGGVILV